MAFRIKTVMGLMACITFSVIMIISLKINSQTISQNDLNYIGKADNYPYINPTSGEFPIVASSPWVDEKTTTVSRLEDVKACGFNCVLTFTTLSRFRKVEPLLRKTNLKIIAGLPEFSSVEGCGVVDTLKKYEVVGGWKVCDEPKEKDFGEIFKLYERIAEGDPNHMAYINMIGPGNKGVYGSCPDYYSFLIKYQQIIHPALLSYDLYPISVKEGKVKVDYSLFYEGFETNAKIATMIGRPFWAYCQSMSFKNSFVERPAANLAYLSFEAFSALGYGAKGLVYWTYCLRKSNDKETYYSALVDLDYNKSKAWYAAQQVNLEIKALTDVFLNTAYGGTWHTGSNQPAICKKFVPGTECLLNVKGGAKGYQISKLYDDSSNYLVIVNKDVENKQKLTLTFDKRYEVVTMMPEKVDEGYRIVEKKMKNSYKTTLNPGRYLIIRYNK